MINFLLGEHQLAHVSSTPGKTVGINFFRVNRSFYFVDLPGYGFSKVPKSLCENWKQLITGYLGTRETLPLILLLMDSRLPPTELDLQMRDWLVSCGREFAVVLTKIDKLSRHAARLAVDRVAQQMRLSKVFPCSTKSPVGRTELLQLILSVV